MKKALIAMSGGVDSSLAAKIMKDEGFECVGCTMRLYGDCGAHDDAEDAAEAAEKLGIPFQVLDLREGFRENVIDRFVAAYGAGQTPNPCILCNRYMKFDRLYRQAEALGCDHVVTGHYARIERDGDEYRLKKAADLSKDQSYVLYFLTQEQLKHTLFPLGEMKKSEVRKLAGANGFNNAGKPDSQDICFVPDGDYAAFLERQRGSAYPPGDFTDSRGNVLGTHKGIVRYTIGQRKGLGIAFGRPMYVTAIDSAGNTVVLGEDKELFSRDLTAGGFSWISGRAPEHEIVCRAKIRYRHQEQPATARPLADGRVAVRFDEPQRAITPGQAAVLYDGDTVLGGGTIEPFR